MPPIPLPFGVIAALPAEARSCRLDPTRFAVRCAGAGPEAATRAAQALIAEGARVLWSWGTAGSLDSTLRPGALVLLTRVVSTGGDSYAAHGPLTDGLGAILRPHRVRLVTGVSSPQPVATREAKQALASRLGGAVVDMETAAIAAAAHAAGVHFVALRTVVDPVEATLPSSALAALAAPERPLRATLAALRRRPRDLPDLIRLAWWYRAALGRLRHTAVIIRAGAWPPPGEMNW